jgi:nucleotide-binding universal stress UspA family protein
MGVSTKNSRLHWAESIGQFEKRAAAAGVAFTAHHVTAYLISQAIIMEEAEKAGCDMIVMVTHGRNPLGEFIFGSHTKKIIAKSRLPVLVLH